MFKDETKNHIRILDANEIININININYFIRIQNSDVIFSLVLEHSYPS